MAAIKSFPNNQDEYIGAEAVMKWLHGRTSGVFGAENNAAVTALASPQMAVQVADGTGWMANAGKDGVVWWVETEETTGSKLQLPIQTADGTLPRIDRVIVEWKTTNYVDLPEVKVLTGKAASSPTAPVLTNSGTVRQISLAAVSVAAGATEIKAADITDERLNAAVCGLVTDAVGIDTSTMDAQFRALLSGIQAELGKLEAGTAVELKKLAFSNVSVSPSAWHSDGTYADYPMRASVALAEVVASMVPEVVFSVSALEAANLAPVAECYNGGVYIYAADTPDAAITIPTILCWRGVTA